MKRDIKVKAVWHKQPDVKLYVLALLELARQLRAQEQRPVEAGDEQTEAGHD
jgi:hypothetical protein